MLQAEVTSGNETVDDLFARFGAQAFQPQPTPDNTPTLWLQREQLQEVLGHLRPRFPMLLDLFGVDERLRENKPEAAADFSVVYHLLDPGRCEELGSLPEARTLPTSSGNHLSSTIPPSTPPPESGFGQAIVQFGSQKLFNDC